MPYDAMIYPESRTGLVVGSGHLTGQELVQACGTLIHDPRWVPGFAEVWDLSAAHEVDVTPEELDRLVQSARDVAARIGENEVVFVTTSDSVSVLVRLFDRLTADLGRTYRVVRTRAEAADALGLDPEALDVAAAG